MLAVPFLQAWAALVVVAMAHIDDRAARALVAFMLDPMHGWTGRAAAEWRLRFAHGRFEATFERALALATSRSLFGEAAPPCR